MDDRARNIQRRQLGGCPCGLAKGLGQCPVCDLGLPHSWFHPKIDFSKLAAKLKQIGQGALILSASVDEQSEARLDFLAATAPPVKKSKLVR